MVRTWKTARVFISSTFRDMQAERDHLVRFVFPRLREDLAPYRVHLVDVDLRWGVTAEQNALDTCREIIDECRPRFLCLLGGRYGWVPPDKSLSITADEVHYGALEDPQQRAHHFFYFRDPAITASIIEPEPGSYREPPGPAEDKLVALKQKIVDAGYTPFIYHARWDPDQQRLSNLEDFGQRVYADLLASIQAEMGATPVGEIDEFAEEDAAIEAFIADRLGNYVLGSRQEILGQLQAHVSGETADPLLCLVGQPGSGKSALLGYFYENILIAGAGLLADEPTLVIPHFVGASAASSNVRQLLRRFYYRLAQVIGEEADIPAEYETLRRSWPDLLARVAGERPVILLIDALNQLDPAHSGQMMRWLPQHLPEDVRVVVSTLPGPALEALRARFQPLPEVWLPPLTATDADAINTTFLDRYNKRLDAVQNASLLDKADAGRPLYLTVALEELRTLGTYEEMTDRIAGLPGQIQPLFHWILERLEADPGFRDETGQQVGPSLVRDYFTFIAAARSGLSPAELRQLIDPDDAQGNLAALQRLVHAYLLSRGPLLDFFHDQFRQAVEGVYLDEPAERLQAHRRLAELFRQQADPLGDNTYRQGNARGLSELSYHLLRCDDPPALVQLFGDAAFLQRYCQQVNVRTLADGSRSYEGIYSLLADLRSAINILDQAGLDEASREMGNLFGLLSPRSGLFRRFPQALLQEIGNYGDIVSATSVAASLLEAAQRQAGRGLHLAGKRHLALPPARHRAQITALATDPAGSLFMTGCADGSVGFWSLDVERPHWLVNAHKSWVTWVAISPTGRQALSAGDDGSVFLWDVNLGTQAVFGADLYQAGPIPWPQANFAAFLDGNTVLLVKARLAYKVDLATESAYWEKHELTPSWLRHVGEAPLLDYAPQAGSYLFTYGSKEDIRLAEVDEGRVKLQVKSQGEPAHLALAADGSCFVVADFQGRLSAFNAAGGQLLDTVSVEPFLALGHAPAGRRFYGFDHRSNLLNIEVDGGLQIDITKNEALYQLEWPAIKTMLALPGDRQLLFGHDDGTLSLYNLREQKIRRQWPGTPALSIGALHPDGEGAIGVEGDNLAGEEKIGRTIVFLNREGERRYDREWPHQHYITGAATLGSGSAMTVDKAGQSVFWQDDRVILKDQLDHAEFTACAAAPRGQQAAAGTLDEQLCLFDGGQVLGLKPFHSTKTAFRAGIAALAVAGEPLAVLAGYFNGLVRFDRAGQGWIEPEESEHSLAVTAVALDPQAHWAAAGNLNGEVHLWLAEKRVRAHLLALHDGRVNALAFSADGRYLFSSGADAFIYGLDPTSGNIVQATSLPAQPVALRVTGHKLIILDLAGTIYHYHIGDESLPVADPIEETSPATSHYQE